MIPSKERPCDECGALMSRWRRQLNRRRSRRRRYQEKLEAAFAEHLPRIEVSLRRVEQAEENLAVERFRASYRRSQQEALKRWGATGEPSVMFFRNRVRS